MKNLMCLMIISILATCSFAANVTVTLETFETGTIGNNLNMDGWQGQWDNSYCNFKTSTPNRAIGNPDTTSKIAEVGAPPAMAYKPFNSQNTITDADTDIFMKATLYIGYSYQWVGTHIGGQGGTAGPVMGEGQMKYDVWQAGFGTDMSSTASAPQYSAIEIALQMKINTADVTQSTGTLYYRALGSTYWTKDPVLQNVNLGLSSTNKPSLWDSWFIRGGWNGGWDNLTLGKGTDIPDSWTTSHTPASDGVKVVENFETGTLGNALSSDGWQDQFPNSNNFIFDQSWISTGVVAEPVGAVNQAWKAFNNPSGITPVTANVYLQADMLFLGEPQWFSCRAGGGIGTQIGANIYQKSTSDANFAGNWQFWLPGAQTPLNGDVINPNGSYQVVLQMAVNQSDVTQSTATFYYRPFGTSAWIKDATLQNFNPGLTIANNPSAWDSWWIRGQYSGGFDNLTLGVGTGASLSCVPPVGDINGDCAVNWIDFATLASQWLKCTNCN
jgi:hypothetical protein